MEYRNLSSYERTGLEKGFGVFVNNILPEISASKLGAAARKEIAKIVGVD